MQIKETHSHSQNTSGFELCVLSEDWNNQLLKLTESSPVQTSRLQILFDRSPDIFAIPTLTSYKIRCLGLFKNSDLLGYAFATYQKRYVNRSLHNVIYLGNIHVIRKGTGGILLRLLSERLEGILLTDTPADYIYAYIAALNKSAMKLVSHGYFNTGVAGQISMNTLLLLYPVNQSRFFTVRRANEADISVIVQLLKEEYEHRLLSPAISYDAFLYSLQHRPNFGIENYFIAFRGNMPVGVCSAWDMTAIKKNRILAYSTGLAISRRAYNVAAKLVGSAPLPDAGEAFRDITIAEYAVKEGNPDIMEALLRHIATIYRKKGYHSLIFGSDAADPLLEAISPFVSLELRSNVIVGDLHENAEKKINSGGLLYADAVQI